MVTTGLFGRTASAMLALPFILAGTVVAQTPTNSLTLEEAKAASLQDQPMLQAFDHRAQASREAATAARALPDPKLTGGVQNLPVTRAEAFHFNADDMTMTTIGVMRDMVRRPKREAAAGVELAQADLSSIEAEAARREIVRSVARAWIDAVEAEQMSRLHLAELEAIDARLSVLQASVPTGEAAPVDVLVLQAERARTHAAHMIDAGNATAARAALARWIGERADNPLPASFPTWSPPLSRSEAEAGVLRHPLLAVARQRTVIADRGVTEAKADRLSDWSWSVMYGHRMGDRSDMLSAQFAISLPVNRTGLQDRHVAERVDLVSAAVASAEDARRQIVAEFQTSWARWEAADAQASATAEAVIPALDAAAKLDEASYAGGGKTAVSVLEARERVLQVRMTLLEQDAARAKAAVELQYFLMEPAR